MGASQRAGNSRLRLRRASFDGKAAEKILRAAHAVARGGTPIIERLEILLERGRRLIGRRLVPFASPKSGFRMRSAFWRRRHPAEGKARFNDAPVRASFEPKGPANRRDVFIEALADLRHMEKRSGAEFRHPHPFHEFARATILALIGEEELLERQLAPLVFLPQRHARA